MSNSKKSEDSVERITHVLAAYAVCAEGETDVSDEDTMVRDLLSDLMHYCEARDYDLGSMLLTAEVNFEAERI